MSQKSQAFEFNFFGFYFAPKLVPTLMTLIMFPVLISLGLWQLDRAEEKRVIDQGVNDAIAKPALQLYDVDLATIDKEIYRTAAIKGQYDFEKQFLLDNRTHNGQPGYHIFSPFLFENSSTNVMTKNAILINRGWIGYQGTRENIPDISLNNEILEILGSIKNIPKSIVLNDQGNEDSSTTLVFKTDNKQLDGISLIQSVQLDKFEKSLNYKLLPVIIELDKTQEKGFVREWQPYYGSIDKHNAYALQWFAMAAIVLFLFLKLNIRKR